MPESPLRARQQQLTRDAIMDALADLVADEGIHAFSVQAVADRAGVSHRTVYRHYPTRNDLLNALAVWLTDRFEQHTGRAESTLYDDIAESVEASFSLMEEFAHYMKAHVRLGLTAQVPPHRQERTQRLREAVESGPAKHLAPRERKAVSAVIRTMVSSATWYALREEHGIYGDEGGETMAWVVQTLFDELERGGGPVARRSSDPNGADSRPDEAT